MKLAKWDPFRDVENLFELYANSVNTPARWLKGHAFEAGDWCPRVDVSETDQYFQISAEVPGVNKEDVKINVEDGVLTIHGERKVEKEESNLKMHRTERFYGSFSRSFSLPANVDENKIEASFKDGLLNLQIPKTEEAKPKAIEVKVK